ncbi:MAG: DUF5320 domain-containing protein [Bacteroidales bacterium]|nr:DUF5320 domain-containing protein [Bacteroidales bacterium]
MPGLNQTGPSGQGPMTGRRMGRCTNYGANLRPNEDNAPYINETQPDFFQGKGMGYGRGMGFGRGRGFRGRGMGFGARFRGGV